MTPDQRKKEKQRLVDVLMAAEKAAMSARHRLLEGQYGSARMSAEIAQTNLSFAVSSLSRLELDQKNLRSSQRTDEES